MNAGRVLIVDDDPVQVQLLQAILEKVGFSTRTSQDGHQALSMIPDFEPEVVLLDLVMPGRDGFELCRLIRAHPRTSKTAVIVMTGQHEQKSRQRSIDCGANDYIRKPFESEDVILRVTNTVRLRRTEEELDRCRRELEELRGRQQAAAEVFSRQVDEFAKALGDRRIPETSFEMDSELPKEFLSLREDDEIDPVEEKMPVFDQKGDDLTRLRSLLDR